VATNNLHQALHGARRALAQGGQVPADVLCLQDNLVMLAPGGRLMIDTEVFAVAAQRALTSGAVEDYRAALGLYTGDLLPEDRDAEWASSDRERLAGLRDAIALGLGQALLGGGHADEAVTLLEPVARKRPGDERLHRVLMDALDQAGRRWDALDIYERLRRVLEKEYAAVPEPATRSAYTRILSGQAPAGHPVVSNLRAPATSFIGRRRELSELLALADRTRLLTLAGPGGWARPGWGSRSHADWPRLAWPRTAYG
jgi:DNA-binding SARP family transcriptional activator